MKRLTLLLLIMAFVALLAACSPAGEPAASELPAELVAQVAATATAAAPASIPRTEVLPAPVIEEPAQEEETAETAADTAAEVEATAALPEVEPTILLENEAAAVVPGEAAVAESGPLVVSGRLDEGAFFLGDPHAPVTLIDYSDFLWGNCRAYVLGTEPQIVQEYVQSGKVKVVFWPVLNHGDPSFYSTLTSECVGQQSPDLFWQVHEVLFEKQSELWRADRDYYVQTAVSVGADQAQFEACYDSAESAAKVQELDTLRRERGIYSQPTFDINGTVQSGAPRFEIFAAVLDDAYNAANP